MSLHDDDDLLAALAGLPAPAQSPAGQAATWKRAAEALDAARTGRSPGPVAMPGARAFVVAHFVPATLLLAGVLYAGGAVRELVQIFGGGRGPLEMGAASVSVAHFRAPHT